MSEIEEALRRLRELDKKVPKPLRLPTISDVKEYERRLNYSFPEHYKKFQLEAGNVTYGTIEPVVCLPDMDPYINPYIVATDGWNEGVSKEWLPFCCDNGCYYCISGTGEIKFWDNEDCSFGLEAWSFPEWINDVWLESNA
ncbi:SMI1/KNR4 family protein [Microbulbifer sp. SA54]|uniref:SMI1/KNR4 family protein n=1 Tax=Microbulbifer sp. SA54 TaxID=3401577 RepID=UPI003AABC49D